jgi:hypothetical protein
VIRDVEEADEGEDVEAPFVVGFDEGADQEGHNKNEADCSTRQRSNMTRGGKERTEDDGGDIPQRQSRREQQRQQQQGNGDAPVDVAGVPDGAGTLSAHRRVDGGVAQVGRHR